MCEYDTAKVYSNESINSLVPLYESILVCKGSMLYTIITTIFVIKLFTSNFERPPPEFVNHYQACSYNLFHKGIKNM